MDKKYNRMEQNMSVCTYTKVKIKFITLRMYGCMYVCIRISVNAHGGHGVKVFYM